MDDRRTFLKTLSLWPLAGLPACAPAGDAAPTADSLLAGRAAAGTGSAAALQEPAPVREAVVTDFGAVGDGQADDTDAVLAAAAALGDDAGLLRFPVGVYRVTRPIPVRRPHAVRGAGPRASYLVNLVADGALLDVGTGGNTRVDGAVIEGLGVIGTDAGGPALRLTRSIRCAIRDFWTTGHPGFALDVRDTLSCVFDNVGSWRDGGGLAMAGASNSNRFYELRVQRCTGERAVEIVQSDNATFFGGILEENAMDGMVAANADGLALYGLRFEQNNTSRDRRRAHLKVRDSAPVAVDGCLFSGVNDLWRRVHMQGVDAIRVTSSYFAGGRILDVEHDAGEALIGGNRYTTGVEGP